MTLLLLPILLACAKGSGDTGSVHPQSEEICNGIDDDGDGDIDEDAVDASGWYPDGDGDGFGDASADPELSCGGSHLVADASDCNDGDADVFPGATERCNGVDDDCDETTGEGGTALFVGEDGTEDDWTGPLGEGTASAAATVDITRSGTLQLCEGAWYTTLRVRADLSVVGMQGGVVLDGVGETGVIIIRQSGVAVSISDLTIQNGAGSGAAPDEYTAGGGVECDCDATLTLERVDLSSNRAGVGGGLYVRGCDVSVSGGSVSGNGADRYGGGVALFGGTLAIQAATVSSNTAAFGGGVAVVGFDGDASATLTDVYTTGNDADIRGGGLLVEDALIDCISSATTAAGPTSNTAEEGGGAYVGPGGELSSSRCSWGESGDDNTPDDVFTTMGGSAGPFGDTETFVCDEDGCTQ